MGPWSKPFHAHAQPSKTAMRTALHLSTGVLQQALGADGRSARKQSLRRVKYDTLHQKRKNPIDGRVAPIQCYCDGVGLFAIAGVSLSSEPRQGCADEFASACRRRRALHLSYSVKKVMEELKALTSQK